MYMDRALNEAGRGRNILTVCAGAAAIPVLSAAKLAF